MITTKEAIEYLSGRYLVVGSKCNPPEDECKKHNEVIDIAIKALKYVQQYMAIGTVEECRLAMERHTQKKTTLVTRSGGIIKFYPCPTCSTPDKYMPVYPKQKYCFNCGQAIDWSKDDE